MPRFPYTFFDNFVVRVPLLSYKEFQNIFSENTNDEKLQEIFRRTSFKESIYLASSDLYLEMEKLIDSNIDFNESSKYRLKNTLLKYFNRMSTRCTPFGLFSSVGIGYFDKEDSFPEKYSDWQRLRETKFDMYFSVALSQYLLSIQDIQNKLLFFPNNSIYKVGNKIRYIEHESKGMKRDYVISSAPLSQELEKILNYSNEGKTVPQMIAILNSDNITSEESFEYIEELIENRVIVSEMEPNISGVDFLDSIIFILNRIGAEKKKNILLDIKNQLSKLDACFENSVSSYDEIEKSIQTLNIEYEKKYLFQTDLYFDNQIGLSYHWKKEIKKCISFLNKITLNNSQNSLLEKFKVAFYERFENEEIPLAFALDTEAGIGYRQNVQSAGIHPYIEDLIISFSSKNRKLEISLNPVQIILNQKTQATIAENKFSIQLSDEDFLEFEEEWNDLSDTLYFMTEIVSDDNSQKLYLNFGSANAGRLLTRFDSEKSKIRDLVKEISKKENDLKTEQILAEIIHLPEARTGNILKRPQMRNYEIPYLAKSLLPVENQIPVDDLLLSIKNDRLFLRSKSHDKEIVPYLTNAHNYSANSLPVYHFLCDLSSQNIRSGLSFDWGDLGKIYHFLPRVEYDNIILSKARWKISNIEIKRFLSLNQEQIMIEVENWRELRQIPQWIQWVKADNTLLINFKNWELVNLFFASVKNEKEVFIEEFLCNKKQNYTSQFIFPLYKNLK